MRPAADDIASGAVNPCCLREDNLFLEELDEDEGRSVRRCRHCGRRHYWLRADPIELTAIFGSPHTILKKDGKRHITMGADPGRFSGRT